MRRSILIAILFASSISLNAAENAPWPQDLAAEKKAALADGKPLLVLIRNAQDAGSLDAGEWLRAKELKPLLEQLRAVAVWNGNPELKEMKFAPQSGLLFLTPQGEPIAIEEVPLLRAELKPLLERVLAAPKAMEESARPAVDEKGRPNQAMQRRLLRGLSDDLRNPLGELMQLARAQNDPKAPVRGKEIVDSLLARTMTRDECLRSAGILQMAIAELDLAGAGEKLAAKIQKEAPVGRIAADAFLDLAEAAFSQGRRDDALKLAKDAEKASENGESPTFYRTVLAMRALWDGKHGPNHSKWAKREVLDVVVLVSDMRSYAKAIARWDENTFFPVLFRDDLYAPKFIAAFKPAQVILVPPEVDGAPSPVTAEQLRSAAYMSWKKHVDGPLAPNLDATSDEDVLKRLNSVAGGPSGIVITDGTSGETAGALALAAGRFQPLETIVVTTSVVKDAATKVATTMDQLPKSAAWDFTKEINARMARWNLPKRDDGWSFITLAGAYPFRYSGDNDGYGYGTTYALDDLIGRDETSTRHSVVGRLIGDKERSAYQAMCSLFLQPENVFLFNTYGLNPKSIWGAYRMESSENLFKDRFAVTTIKGEAANIETFREHEFPWNRDNLITINSSGGHTDWSVGGGGGTADDFPVGAPCAIHVTHSGSAGDPYNPDTLAGRAIWGGAFFYFGSTAEPFLTAFQPPSVYAPLIANGAPLAAAFRKRTGNYFGWPWRLMIVGDPQFALRSESAKRKPYVVQAGDQVFKGEPRELAIAGNGFEETLQRSRWIGDNPSALSLSMRLASGEKIALANWPSTLPNALEELIFAKANDVALNLWKLGPEDARKVYAARIYARQAAGALLDKALAAEDFTALQTWMDALLTTGPAGNFVDRWLDKILAVAEKKKEDAAPWLLSRMGDEKFASYRGSFAKRLSGARLKALNQKATWTAEDKAAAIGAFSDAVKAKVETELLVKQYEEFQNLCVAKLAGTSADSVAADVKAIFKPDSDEGKRVETVFAEIALRKTFFKDWLLLGPFKDEQKLDPAKLDFAASFTDHGQKIEWKRPFNEAAFGSIDLTTLFNPHDNVHCYAAAELIVDKDTDGVLLLGSDDGIVAWLDCKEIHRNAAARGLKPDEDSVTVKLTAGKHTLLLRIDQGSGGWGFCARVAAPGGKSALSGVTWKCPK